MLTETKEIEIQSKIKGKYNIKDCNKIIIELDWVDGGILLTIHDDKYEVERFFKIYNHEGCELDNMTMCEVFNILHQVRAGFYMEEYGNIKKKLMDDFYAN